MSFEDIRLFWTLQKGPEPVARPTTQHLHFHKLFDGSICLSNVPFHGSWSPVHRPQGSSARYAVVNIINVNCRATPELEIPHPWDTTIPTRAFKTT